MNKQTLEELYEERSRINREIERVGRLFDDAEGHHFITGEDGEFLGPAKAFYGEQIHDLYSELGAVQKKINEASK